MLCVLRISGRKATVNRYWKCFGYDRKLVCHAQRGGGGKSIATRLIDSCVSAARTAGLALGSAFALLFAGILVGPRADLAAYQRSWIVGRTLRLAFQQR